MIIGVPERCSGRCSGDAMAAVGGLERCSGHCFALCAERCSGRCSGDAMAAVGGLERCSGHCFALCAERCSGCGRSARRWRSGVASCGLAIGWAGGDYVAGSKMVGFVVRIPLDVYFYVGISKKKTLLCSSLSPTSLWIALSPPFPSLRTCNLGHGHGTHLW